MADDQVFEQRTQLRGEARRLLQLGPEHAQTDYDVAQQLPVGAVAETAGI